MELFMERAQASPDDDRNHARPHAHTPASAIAPPALYIRWEPLVPVGDRTTATGQFNDKGITDIKREWAGALMLLFSPSVIHDRGGG